MYVQLKFSYWVFLRTVNVAGSVEKREKANQWPNSLICSLSNNSTHLQLDIYVHVYITLYNSVKLRQITENSVSKRMHKYVFFLLMNKLCICLSYQESVRAL